MRFPQVVSDLGHRAHRLSSGRIIRHEPAWGRGTRHPGRDGKDLKGLVLFLASTASDYVHGENVVLDGGFSIYH